MSTILERARAEAARAIHDRYEQMTHWVKTLGKTPRPLETSGIKDVHRLDANAAIDAFLAAARADGWKLVRREASDEMVEAYVRDGHGRTVGDVANAGWSAMWDSAPEVKP